MMWASVKSAVGRVTWSYRCGLFFALLILLFPQGVVSQVVGDVPMHKDHRAVLISGFATGSAEGPSVSSISLNGIEFVVNTTLPADGSQHEIGSPMGTCEAMYDQISSFTVGVNAIPEFEAACIGLAGNAAILLLQANSKKYPVPSEENEENEAARWLKAKRRFVLVKVSATDHTQKLTVVK